VGKETYELRDWANATSERPKTFTANELKQKAGEVFREVDRHGECLINHASYSDRIFVLTSRERRKEGE
jgi:hypothetical protein